MPRERHDDSDDVDRYRERRAEQQRDERQRGEQYQQDDASNVFSGSHDKSPVYFMVRSLGRASVHGTS
jgi:hypothetical protein